MIYISRTNVHDTIPLRFVGKIIILMDNEIITEDRKNLVFFYTFVFSNLLMTVSYKHIKLKLRDDRGRKISPSFPNWLSLRRDHNIYRIYSIYLLISYPIPKILIQWMFRWRERTLFNDDCSVMMFCTEAFAWTYHCYYCLYIYIYSVHYNIQLLPRYRSNCPTLRFADYVHNCLSCCFHRRRRYDGNSSFVEWK